MSERKKQTIQGGILGCRWTVSITVWRFDKMIEEKMPLNGQVVKHHE
jgi:hypothetical protein